VHLSSYIWRWAIAVLAGAAILGIVILGMTKAPAATPAQSGVPPPVPVSVATAARADVPVRLGALGSVVAFNTVTVRPRVDGQLMRDAFREGQFVQSGDLLAEIDPRPPLTGSTARLLGLVVADQQMLAERIELVAIQSGFRMRNRGPHFLDEHAIAQPLRFDDFGFGSSKCGYESLPARAGRTQLC